MHIICYLIRMKRSCLLDCDCPNIGKVQRGAFLKVVRGDDVIYDGNISSLKHHKVHNKTLSLKHVIDTLKKVPMYIVLVVFCLLYFGFL